MIFYSKESYSCLHSHYILGHCTRDEICEPLTLDSVGLKFLGQDLELTKKWKLSGRRGLTRETFTACIQSIEGIMELTEHLILQHNFKYVLPGKFVSDPPEARFGWYHQANGDNYFISLKQLLQTEKKIRCLSLLQQRVLHSASRLFLDDSSPTSEQTNVVPDTSDLKAICAT